MANLEEKILNGPNVGYCSSSEDDDEDAPVVISDQNEPNIPIRKGIRNTGPKGVIEDWRAFVQEQELARIENEKKVCFLSKNRCVLADILGFQSV